IDVRLERHDHEQDQHQTREQIDQIIEIDNEHLDIAPTIARHRAEGGAQHERNDDRDESKKEIHLDTHDQAGQDIPTQEVDPQQVTSAPQRRIQEVNYDLLQNIQQPLECTQDIQHQHQNNDEQTITDINQIQNINIFPK